MRINEYLTYLKFSASLLDRQRAAIFRSSINSCESLKFGDIEKCQNYIPQFRPLMKILRNNLEKKYNNEKPIFTSSTQFNPSLNFKPKHSMLLLANTLSLYPVTPEDIQKFAKEAFSMSAGEYLWEKMFNKLSKAGMVKKIKPKTYLSNMIGEYDLGYTYKMKKLFFKGAVSGFIPFNKRIPQKINHIIKVRVSNIGERNIQNSQMSRSKTYALFDPLSSDIITEKYETNSIKPGQIELMLDYFQNKPYGEVGAFLILSYPQVDTNFFENDKIPSILKTGEESLNSIYQKLNTYELIDDGSLTSVGERISGIFTRTPNMVFPHLDYLKNVKERNKFNPIEPSLSDLNSFLFLGATKKALSSMYNDWNQINEKIVAMDIKNFSKKEVWNQLFYKPWKLQSELELSRFAIKKILSEQFNSGSMDISVSSHPHLYGGHPI